MFTRKGQLYGSLSGGIGYNLQAAYSPASHLAVAGSILYANNRGYRTYDFRIHESYDFAVGYYLSRKWHFSVFSGYGKGKGHGRHRSGGIFFPLISHAAEGAYEKFFLQPTIGRKVRMFEFAFTPRVSLTNFYTVHVTPGNHPSEVALVPVYFFEPAITIKFFPQGWDGFYVMKQFGINRNLTSDQKVFFDYTLVHWNVGAGIKINAGRKRRRISP